MAQIRNDNGELRNDIGEIWNDMAQIRNDNGELRNDIGEIRNDMAQIRNDISELRNEIGEIRKDTGEIRQPAVTREVINLSGPLVPVREAFAAPSRRVSRIVEMSVRYYDGTVGYQFFEEDDLALTRQVPQQTTMGYGYPRRDDRSDDSRHKRPREE